MNYMFSGSIGIHVVGIYKKTSKSLTTFYISFTNLMHHSVVLYFIATCDASGAYKKDLLLGNHKWKQ